MQVRELGQHPVSDTSPAGADPRQCAEYERLLEEIGKLGSLQGAAAVDWRIVTDSAAAVLERQAKDIPAAVYLSVGLAQTEGLPGMADGLRVLADILSRWWENCFPPLKRLRARANMLGWWRERLAPLLEAAETPVPAALREDLLASLAEIDVIMSEHLPDLPSLRDLLDRVRGLAITAEAEAAPPPGEGPVAEVAPAMSPTPPQSPREPAPEAVQSAPAEPATPPGDAQEALSQFLAAARTCAALAFGEGLPRASAAWTALYAALWGRIDALPPAENGITALPSPPDEELEACRNLLTAGRHAEAAAALARLLPACPFCLDAQYLLFSALTACARPLDAARVRRECRALAERLPGLTELSFADGRPLADADTRQWLREADAANAVPKASPHDEVAARARTTAAEGNIGHALDMLETARRACGPGSLDAFRLRLEQARLLLAAGHAPVAAPLAEELEETLDRHGLAVWQSDLCLEALRICHAVWAGLETTEARQRAAALAAAICRLRPSQSPLL